MTRRRILCKMLMLVVIAAVGLSIGMGAASAEATIINPSIGNAAVISDIDFIKANAYLSGTFGVDLITVIKSQFPETVLDIKYTVELYQYGLVFDSKLGTYTFHHRIYNGYDGLVYLQRDEVGPDYYPISSGDEAETLLRTLDNVKLTQISSSDDYYIKVQALTPVLIGSSTTSWAQSPSKTVTVTPPPSITWSQEITPGQTISVDVNQALDLYGPIIFNDGGNSPEGYATVITDSTDLQLLNPSGYSSSTTTIYNGEIQKVWNSAGAQTNFNGYLADAYKVVPTDSFVGFSHLYIKPTAAGIYRVYWRGALDTSDNGLNFVRSPSSGTITDPLGYEAKYVTINAIEVDTTNPTIFISSPYDGQSFTTSAVTVSGSASDAGGLSKVEVKVGAGNWQLASLSGTSWTKSVTLASGSNTIYAKATDTSNNIKDASSVVVTYTPPPGNTAPNTPSSPSGPSSGYTGTSYSFSTSTTDPDGDNIYYTFDWGDGTSATSSTAASGNSVSKSHSWSTSGTYTVKVQATDANAASSGWSSSTSITISTPPTGNTAPNTPSSPSGPTSGYSGISYSFSTSTTDLDGDNIYYTFDWGDGSTSRYPSSGTVTSGTTASISHSWSTSGTHTVKVQATDINGASSDWSSATISITVPSILSIGEAVDNTNYVWTTGGSANWFGQTVTSYYGGDAAQSGPISDGQNTWIETTVTGPGTVSFYWKGSTVEVTDLMGFYIDGTREAYFNGNRDWEQRTYDFVSGSHILKWKYAKYAIGGSGSDAGWVDKVVITTLINPPNTPSLPSGPTSGYTETSYSFSTSTTDPDGDNIYYTFDWGDSSTSRYPVSGTVTSGTTASMSHSWSNLGTHTVKVQATDATGTSSGWSSFNISIIDTPNLLPTASITSISPNPVNEGQTISFSGGGIDSDGSVVAYNWRSSIDGQLSTSSSFSSSTLSVGTHTIYYKVMDNDNDWSNEISHTLTVNDITPPTIDIFGPTDGITVGESLISVYGTAHDISGISQILINGNTGEMWNSSINEISFSTKINLNKGDNEIVVTAIDNYGNSNSTTINVKLKRYFNLSGNVNILWNTTLNGNPTESFNVGDVTGDNISDIVIIDHSDTSYIYHLISGVDGAKVWTNEINFSYYYDFDGRTEHVGDLDGDGLDDLVSTIDAFDKFNNRLTVIIAQNGLDGTNLWQINTSSNNTVQNYQYVIPSNIGDINNDAKDDLVFIDEYNTNGIGYYNISIISGITGLPIWSYVEPVSPDLWVYIGQDYGDLDRDGVVDFFVRRSSSINSYLTVISGKTGSIIWSKSSSDSIEYRILSDVNSDGFNDVVISTNGQTAILRGYDATQLWIADGDLADTISDVNGDGIEDIVVSEPNIFGELQLIALKGDTGEIIWTTVTNSTGRFWAYQMGDENSDGVVDFMASSAIYDEPSIGYVTKKFYGISGLDGMILWCKEFNKYNDYVNNTYSDVWLDSIVDMGGNDKHYVVFSESESSYSPEYYNNYYNLMSINGSNGDELWKLNKSQDDKYWYRPTFADIDNDGVSDVLDYGEILDNNGFSLYAYARMFSGNSINDTIWGVISNAMIYATSDIYYDYFDAESYQQFNDLNSDGATDIVLLNGDELYALTVNTPYVDTPPIKGDLNNNGYVDIGDVAKVAFMVAGKVPEELSADFNENGYVDIGDAAKIAFYLAGKVGEL